MIQVIKIVDIPRYNIQIIYDFLGHLQTVMEGTCQDLSQIPDEYQSKFHYLAQQGAIFLVINYIGSQKGRRLFNYST